MLGKPASFPGAPSMTWAHEHLVGCLTPLGARAFFAASLTAMTVATATLAMPDRYTSTARILTRDLKSSKAAGIGALGAALGSFALPGVEDTGLTYLDILQSRSVAQALLDHPYRFRERTWRFGRWRTRELTLRAWLAGGSEDHRVAQLRRILEAKRDLKSGLVTVSVTTPSPDLSQQVVRDLVAELEHFIVSRNRDQAGSKARFAAERLLEAEQEARLAEHQLQRFLDVNRNVGTSTDPQIRLAGLRLEAGLDLKRTLVANLAWAREQALLDEKNATPVLTVLDPGQVPDVRSGPPRAILTLLASLGGAGAVVGWARRRWLVERFLLNGGGPA